MDAKIQAISLGSILTLLKQSIVNSDAGISEHNFKSKLQIMFSAYMHQNFLIAHNSFMNSYIQNKQGTLHEELDGYSRTFFIISTADASSPVKLLGMITLRMNNLDISSLEKSLKKKLILHGKSPNNLEYIPVMMIEQLAKNALIEDNPIHANQLLAFAINKLEEARKITGGALIVLNGINVPKVIDLYQSFGFTPFGSLITKSTSSYQPMYLKLDTGIDSIG